MQNVKVLHSASILLWIWVHCKPTAKHTNSANFLHHRYVIIRRHTYIH